MQCSYKRVITLLNDVYLTASYITTNMPTVTVRVHVRNCQYRTFIPHDNHSDLNIFSLIMISKSYRKFTTFPDGDYYVFHEYILSNKDSSDEIIGQLPWETL